MIHTKIKLSGLIILLLMGRIQSAPTPILPISQLNGVDIQITQSYLAEYPDLCTDHSNNIWVVYTELVRGKERIKLVKVHNGVVIDSCTVSSVGGYEFAPRITVDKSDRIWVVWSAKRKDNWDIYLRGIEQGQLLPEQRLTNNTGVDFYPSISLAKDNAIWLAWSAQQGETYVIMASCIVNSRLTPPSQVSSATGQCFRPVILSNDKKGYLAWDCREGNSQTIWFATWNGVSWEMPQRISSSFGFNFCPYLAFDHQQNLTCAWHSNILPRGDLNYNNWLWLRHFRQGRWRGFLLPGNEADLLKNGEDQGLEFAQMVYDQRNRLWLLGRSSQGFYVQCLDREKRSPIYRLPIEGWGGRGTEMHAILGSDGQIYTVRRDLRYIYLNQFDPDKVIFSENILPLRVSPQQIKSQPNQVPQIAQPFWRLPDSLSYFWGDLHQHSALSDGMGTVDECLLRSRYNLNYDFAALTDHEWFTANYLLPSEWEIIKVFEKSFSQDSIFTVIPGYEWTTSRLPNGYGHKNVYFDNFAAPIFSYLFDANNSLALFAKLAQYGGIAVPHHVGWTGTDWQNHQPLYQPVIEIVSTHGAFEYPGNEPITHRGGMPGYFIQDGLAKGLVFGFVGGSDGHGLRFHHGVGTKASEWTSGMTAIIARSNTLAALLDAIRQRRVYATSGDRIFLDLRINDCQMGSILETKTPPKILIRVQGSAPLHYVYLLRDNQIILVLGKDSVAGQGVQSSYEDTECPKGRHFYYLRVIQENGAMAWSSPIWVNYAP